MLSNLKNPARELPPLEFPKLHVSDASELWRNLPYQQRVEKIRKVCEIRTKQLERTQPRA